MVGHTRAVYPLKSSGLWRIEGFWCLYNGCPSNVSSPVTRSRQCVNSPPVSWKQWAVFLTGSLKACCLLESCDNNNPFWTFCWLVLWKQGLTCSLGWTAAHYIAQASLKLLATLLPHLWNTGIIVWTVMPGFILNLKCDVFIFSLPCLPKHRTHECLPDIILLFP